MDSAEAAAGRRAPALHPNRPALADRHGHLSAAGGRRGGGGRIRGRAGDVRVRHASARMSQRVLRRLLTHLSASILGFPHHRCLCAIALLHHLHLAQPVKADSDIWAVSHTSALITRGRRHKTRIIRQQDSFQQWISSLKLQFLIFSFYLLNHIHSCNSGLKYSPKSWDCKTYTTL